MKTGKILESILKDIAWSLYPSPDKDTEREEIINDIDEDIKDVIEDWNTPAFKHQLTKGRKAVIEAIAYRFDHDEDDSFLEKEIEDCPKYFSYDVDDKYDYQYIKPLNTKTDPYLTSALYWWNGTWLVDFGKNEDAWFSIMRIWQKITPNSTEANDFWESINTREKKTRFWLGVIGSDEKIELKDAWKYYSFCYLKWVCSNRFDLPKDLSCGVMSVKEGLTYDGSISYGQFFDIYDVINEVQHSQDILTRYLKVYQVVEQLAYRRKLIGIINTSEDTDCSFVRELESLTESFKTTEKSVIISSVNDLFPHISDAVNNEIGSDKIVNNACKECLAKRFSVSIGADGLYSNDSIADLIYKLRNSIVHNKETEFHMTFNNYETYKSIVKLMELLITSLLNSIIELMEVRVNSPISYRKPTLRLY